MVEFLVPVVAISYDNTIEYNELTYKYYVWLAWVCMQYPGLGTCLINGVIIHHLQYR
jgi:hypothetical protein